MRRDFAVDAIERTIARLTNQAKAALSDAQGQDDGEVYVPSYSVPDRLTKSYRVHGRGDPLNDLGLAVRDELKRITA